MEIKCSLEDFKTKLRLVMERGTGLPEFKEKHKELIEEFLINDAPTLEDKQRIYDMIMELSFEIEKTLEVFIQ